MTIQLIPIKLEKDPIIDVVFEMRFASSTAASGILPGFLFAKFTPAEWRIEALPISDIPSQIRSSDLNLRYQPVMRIHWDDFILLVGDRVIGIACKMPYQGWDVFKSRIIKVVGVLAEAKIVQTIERYSLKYSNILEGRSLSEQIQKVDIDLRVGSHTVKQESITIRVEFPNDDFMNIIQIVAEVTAQMVGGKERKGSLVDIDTLCNYTTNDLHTFTNELPDRLETIHSVNKKTFFDCLRQETVDSLVPVYE
jgi:uncharacterized protein (TIGR04255 family)